MTRYTVLENLIRRHGWKRGAELGVYQGETFFHLLDAFPDLSMVGVDRWERTPGPKQDRETGFASYAEKPMEDFAEAVKARVVKYGYRAVIHHAETVPTADLYQNGEFDFVFIDASHDTESVRADIRAWRAKVRADGMILGHDINWPSVQRAVAAELGDWDDLGAHIWAVKV